MTLPFEKKSKPEPELGTQPIGDRLLHQMRTGQAMAKRAEKSLGTHGWPKPRRPSMPPMPWDKKDSE